MFNIIKMDLYKMFKMRSFYVVNIIAMVSIAIMLLFVVVDVDKTDLKGSNATTVYEDKDQNVKLGVDVDDSQLLGTEQNVLTIYSSFMSSGFYLFFSVIFTMIFALSENKNGYIKNIGGQVRHRWQLFVSKLTAIFIYIFMFDLILLVVQSVIWFIAKGNFGAGSFSEYITFIISQFLLQYVFVIVCTAIATITKSRVFSMTAAVCLSFGMGKLACMGIDAGIYKLLNREVSLEKYLITTKISTMLQNMDMAQIRNIIVFAAVYFIVSVFVGIISVEKRDMV